MLLGPLLSALILAVALDGRVGIGTLFAGFVRWRVPAGYYLLALFTAPVIALLVLGLFSVFSPIFVPTVFGVAGGVPLLATGTAIGLATGFIEELGWTGFAARRLLSTKGVIATAILIGVTHGLWHLLAGYYWGDGASFGLLFIPYFAMAWIVTLAALRLLMVWLYQQTQSALMAALAHAGYTSALIMLWPVGTSPADTTLWTAVFALALLGAVVALTSWLPARRLTP